MYLIIVIVNLTYEKKYKYDNHVSQWVVGTIIAIIADAAHATTRNPLANRDMVWFCLYKYQ